MSLDDFFTTMDRLAGTPGSWGFIVVRTAAASDDSQWTRAYDALRRLALGPNEIDYDAWNARQNKRPRAYPRSAAKTLDLFNLPVLDLQTARADDESLDDLRDLVNQQIDRSLKRKQRSPQRKSDREDVNDEDGDGESTWWPSKLHLDGYLVVDNDAMAELLTASDSYRAEPSYNEGRPTVVFLDAVDPHNVRYQGGSPFMGWMRVEVQSIRDLELDLELHGHNAEKRSLMVYPHRQWHGQIPVYRGQGHARFIDPRPGEMTDKYIFPQGTPRGWQGTVATWESIPEKYRGRQSLGAPPAWFVRRLQQEKNDNTTKGPLEKAQ